MMKSRAVFAAGAVFLSAALAVTYFQVQEPAVKTTEVLRTQLRRRGVGKSNGKANSDRTHPA